MRVNPEELVELRNHGPMKLRCAVARAMILLPTERLEATIIRQYEPLVLTFQTIKDLSDAFNRGRLRPQKRGASKRGKSHRQSRLRDRQTTSGSGAA
jgi:hypothetical protein